MQEAVDALAKSKDALKAITPLIDAGKITEAKRELQAEPSTVVVTDQIVPLPVLRSEALLGHAETLAEKEARTDAENVELSSKLAAIRNQLEMAQLLGYGEKGNYKALYKQLKQIEEKQTTANPARNFSPS